MPEKYGVESIKLMLDFIITMTEKSFSLDTDNDGDIETSEVLTGLGAPLFSQLPVLYARFPFLRKEARDLSDEEIAELTAHVDQNFNLPGKMDKLEDYIKDVINWLHYNYRFFKMNIEFYRK